MEQELQKRQEEMDKTWDVQEETEANYPERLHVATQGVSSSRTPLLTLTHGRLHWGDARLSLPAEGPELLGPQTALQG